jgi:hypothetical protein
VSETGESFTCARCGGTFGKTRSDEEAMAEAESLWTPETMADPQVTICRSLLPRVRGVGCGECTGGAAVSAVPVLRHIEMPPASGNLVTLFIPAGNEMVTRADPLLPGAGFTLDFGSHGGLWRSELRSASFSGDGVTAELEITGRYAEALL